MAQSVEFTVERLDKNYIRVTWDNTASDTDWVYLNGVKSSSTPVIGSSESYIKARLDSDRTAEIQVINNDTEPGTPSVVPGYLPVINWKSSISAYRYLIYIDGVLVRTLVADSTKYSNKWQTTQYLSDGWHYLRVVARDKAGNTENSRNKWFRVWVPGTPVSSIAVSEGTGAGLYDITLGV